jgi:hypothetical protein
VENEVLFTPAAHWGRPPPRKKPRRKEWGPRQSDINVILREAAKEHLPSLLTVLTHTALGAISQLM